MKTHETKADSYRERRIGLRFLFVSLLLGLLKFSLVRGDEIATEPSPHDGLWFVQSARQWYWFGAYDAPFGIPPFIRLSAYPLFIALTRQTGIPLRIVTELLFVTAAFVFTASIIKSGQPWLLAILLYAAIIFHPVSFQANHVALPDSFFASMLLLALACMIILLLKRDDIHRTRHAILTGVALAILWHIRQENVLIVALLMVYALIALFRIGIRKPRRVIIRELAIVVLIPAAIILLVSLTVKTVNYAKFGVFAEDALSGPGFEAAGRALLRIKPVQPTRFVVVPKESRERAYRVSPAFRELEPILEGPEGLRWASYARGVGVQVDGEISTPHFFWALNKGAYDIGYNKSAGEADQYFQRVANEINAACDDGRLQCRWAFSSVIEPRVQTYAPYLPGSFRKIHRLFFQKFGPVAPGDSPSIPGQVRDLFDEMANRRTAATAPYSMNQVSGWAFNLKDNLRTVLVRDWTGRVLASTDQLTPRPDVASGYAASGLTVPLNSGFYLKYSSDSELSANNEVLVFISWSGAEWAVPRTRLPPMVVTHESLTYAVDVNKTVVRPLEPRLRVQGFIGATYGPATAVLAYLGLGSILVLLLCYRSINPKEAIYSIVALLLAAVITRVMFFALIDASSWSATIPRYFLPVMPLYTCVLLLLIAQAFNVITIRLNRRDILRKVLHKFSSSRSL